MNPLRHTRRQTPAHRQRGVAMVEFALVSMLFITLLLGIVEFSRWVFTLNAASEVTRWGARLATVCDRDDSNIKAQIRTLLPDLSDAQISITYLPTGCTANSCKTVVVALTDITFTPLIPFLPGSLPLPPFTTSMPRELMNSTNNPVCAP